MRGLFLSNQGLQYREDLARPEVVPGWALVRVERAGICSTDLQLQDGLYDFHGIPGHEFVGLVEALGTGGSSAAEWLGQRVVADINIVCGSCDLCRRGFSKHCRSRRVLGIRGHNGAFTEYLTVPLVNLHKVPDTLSLDAAVLAEPLAAVLDILDRVKLQPGSLVAIVGDGRLAQLAARVLPRQLCKVQVIGRHEEKLLRLPAWVGRFLEPPVELLRTCDVVVECSGSSSGLQSALDLVRPGGSLVLKSTFRQNLAVSPEQLVVNEITLLGSRCCDLSRALEFLCEVQKEEQKKDQALTNLVDAHFVIEEGLAAFDYVREQPVIKVVLSLS